MADYICEIVWNADRIGNLSSLYFFESQMIVDSGFRISLPIDDNGDVSVGAEVELNANGSDTFFSGSSNFISDEGITITTGTELLPDAFVDPTGGALDTALGSASFGDFANLDDGTTIHRANVETYVTLKRTTNETWELWIYLQLNWITQTKQARAPLFTREFSGFGNEFVGFAVDFNNIWYINVKEG